VPILHGIPREHNAMHATQLFIDRSGMRVRTNFSRGGNVNILLILVRLLTIQRKCTFTKRLTFSARLNHKENAPCYDNSHKNALVWQA